MSADYMKFKQWFDHKLEVGAYPNPEMAEWRAEDYAYVINVSGAWYAGEAPMYHQTRYFWFPMSEGKKDMGMNSIYGALVILWEAERRNDRVYLHCHSGSNRSWTVAAAYHYLRTGTHLDRPVKSGPHLNKLLANCDRHYLPHQSEMEAWLAHLRKELETGMTPSLLTMSKIECINNF